MSRHDAREKAMQLLYQIDSQDSSPSEQIDLFLEQRTPLAGQETDIEEEDGSSAVVVLEESDQVYLKNLVRGVLAKADELDAMYSKFLKRWTVDRLPRVDRVLLRMGTYEMLYSDDIPNSVAISEIIRLCKIYAEEDSYSYINAVLGKVNAEAMEGREESVKPEPLG